eukprot:scaffold25741_cov155-Isochrysis_galbana.AAC.1
MEPREVLGVGVARVRASGSRMMAWITYGGPDGAGRRAPAPSAWKEARCSHSTTRKCGCTAVTVSR